MIDENLPPPLLYSRVLTNNIKPREISAHPPLSIREDTKGFVVDQDPGDAEDEESEGEEGGDGVEDDPAAEEARAAHGHCGEFG